MRGERVNFPAEVAAQYSAEVKLVELCWAEDANARPSSGEIVKALEALLDNVPMASYAASSRRAATSAVARGGGEDTSKNDQDDHFIANIPKDLTERDCLVAKFKGKTLDEQRAFFVVKMGVMARQGRDEEDGWKYKGKTNALGVEVEDQLDVYERTVEWSAVKQLRSVVETADFSCDEMFDFLSDDIRHRSNLSMSRFQNKAWAGGQEHRQFVLESKNSVLTLYFKVVPFPWPFTPRYTFVVQHYQRLRAGDGSSWFLCYNHDAEHEYFAQQRNGFQRMSIKYQGMVGVPCRPMEEADGGGGGARGAKTTTRLTWLMNIDFQGLVPTVVLQTSLLTSACYPRLMVIEMEKAACDKKEADHADTVSARSASFLPRASFSISINFSRG